MKKLNFDKMGGWNGVHSLIGVTGLIVGVAVAYWGIQEGKISADKAMKIQTGEMEFAIDDVRVLDSQVSLFYFTPPSCPEELIAELPLTLVNTGAGPIDDAEIILSAPSRDEGVSLLLGEDTENFMQTGGELTRAVSRDYRESSGMAFVTYRTENIPPDAAARIREPIPLISGAHFSEVDLPNGTSFNVGYDISTQYSALLVWNSSVTKKFTISISRIQADNLQSALARIPPANVPINGVSYLLEPKSESCIGEQLNFFRVGKVHPVGRS